MTRPAELYACLYAREFPAQALLRLRPELRDQPCAVMEGEPPLQQVCSLNRRARMLGVALNMTKVEVETFPAVALLARSPQEEAATSAVLLECAGAFSPRVENCREDGAFLCVLDIAGTEKLFGPPEALAKSLLDRASALGITARVAVSGNFHAAVALARGMSPQAAARVIPPCEESAALAPLPLSVLNLTEEQAETFSLWGIRTLGTLAALPEKELIARMGQAGKRLRQLARGEAPHLFQPAEPAFALVERMELDSPVALLDSLLFVLGAMLDQLIVRASARALALASVSVTLTLEGGATHARTVRPALPSNDKSLWIKLLHLDLEAHPPQAAILALALTVDPGSVSKEQLGLFSPQLPEPAWLDVTMARIRAIVGEECAGRAVLADTHEPDAFRIEPFQVPSTQPSRAVPVPPRAALRQLRPAEPVSITLQSERPRSFVFREQHYAVEHAYGPWLASGDWWAQTLWGWEQWDILARARDGRLLCCCLARDRMRNQWQVAALYD
ncbi:MAG: DNA polymerase Y family protein [Acidobacteriaceae bacterium]